MRPDCLSNDHKPTRMSRNVASACRARVATNGGNTTNAASAKYRYRTACARALRQSSSFISNASTTALGGLARKLNPIPSWAPGVLRQPTQTKSAIPKPLTGSSRPVAWDLNASPRLASASRT
jgi:hypothetical protein